VFFICFSLLFIYLFIYLFILMKLLLHDERQLVESGVQGCRGAQKSRGAFETMENTSSTRKSRKEVERIAFGRASLFPSFSYWTRLLAKG